MSYGRPSDSAEYGGGGRGGDNYYDNNNEYNGQEDRYGRQEGGYGQQQQNYGYNEGHAGGERYGGGGGGGGYAGSAYQNNDWSAAQEHAQNHAGESGGSGLFSMVVNHLQNNSSRIEQGDIDEGQAVQAHQQLYGGQGGNQHDSQSLGAGAALQALKLFTSQSQGQGGGLGGGAHGGQNQFVGLAMAEASKLFDQQHGQGNVDSSASKQSAVTAAGEMAMNMYLKSQMGGGGSSGGLMSLANKFLS